MTSSVNCTGEYVKWIHDVFSDCVSTRSDYWSFYIGLISLFFWVITMYPQVIKTYKTKKVEGVSPFLFSLWVLGGVTSLIGNIITGGTASQILTSIIFIVQDGTLFSMYLYYKYLYNNNKNEDESSIIEIEEKENIQNIIPLASTALALDFFLPFNKDNFIGTLFGWISTIIYIGAIAPQVILNYKQKYVKDLSPFLFICGCIANTTYITSLLVKSTNLNFLWMQFPWIFGSFVCGILYGVVLIQMKIYGEEPKKELKN